MRQLLGKYPGKTLHQITIMILGVWLGLNTLDFILDAQKVPNHSNTKIHIYSNFLIKTIPEDMGKLFISPFDWIL